MDIASQAISAHESRLADRFVSGLEEIPGAKLYGPSTGDSDIRVPILTFNIEGKSATDIAAHLDGLGLYARSGHFNAQRLFPALGLTAAEGAVRVSFAHYNTIQEVDRLVEALREFTGSP